MVRKSVKQRTINFKKLKNTFIELNLLYRLKKNKKVAYFNKYFNKKALMSDLNRYFVPTEL